MQVMPDFSSMLKKMRKSSGMSQEDVALELHMSISNISRLETGKYEAKLADAWRWANATGAQDIFIATICGIDLSMVQQIIDVSTSVNTIIGMAIGGL